MSYEREVSLLQPLGVSELEERLYGLVLDSPGWPAAEIAKAAGVPNRQTERALASLVAKGLLGHSAGRPHGYLPAPPEAAIGVLIHGRQEELDRIRTATDALEQRFRRGRTVGTADLVEIISGPHAVAQRVRQLQAAVIEELLLLDKPPYAIPPGESIAGELELLRRHVAVRSLYDESVFELPGVMATIAELVDSGEEARIAPNLPTKLMLCDRRVALMPLSGDRPGVATAIVVHESALLATLGVLFDRLWREATLFGVADGAAATSAKLDEFEHQILTLLAAGLSETVIAHQLGVSPRTVSRRVERLMDLHRARSRFQLGLRAAKSGLVTT